MWQLISTCCCVLSRMVMIIGARRAPVCLPGVRHFAVLRRPERRLRPGCMRFDWGRKWHHVPECSGLDLLVRIASRATWHWGQSRRPQSLGLCPVQSRPSAIGDLRETHWGGPALHAHVKTVWYGPWLSLGVAGDGITTARCSPGESVACHGKCGSTSLLVAGF